MKKILCAILASLMLLSLTACGSAETETVVLTMEQNGTVIDYTLEAKGDTVQKIIQTSTIDCSAFSEDEIAIIESAADEYAATYADFEGVTYSMKVEDTDLVETIIIDTTNKDTLQGLSNEGLLPIEGNNADSISLEKTIENLEALGMTVKE